ncbi:MAG: DNA-binding response regulator [Acidiferrobacteraceae bacterium]|jgi:DNA-binding response OmpR family regulator|nr:DNA-binding response regulator [Acidiferrobacteraceae bacterium]MDP6123000.1 response regulator transcription factor [Arenicellales bacterium]MDP6433990.1 response regulator transcription factor [Arenicellales bacterium]MDP6671971.1 response regulator transcription factor [Arenicellales bacterium]MDP6723866.1 response regulator transcription factor [Arenicellales bacterium]|tara:strand:+ start:768 stop:1454 length:687 start_codon:yes stop_codon:yes gene_type:complete
MAKILLIDDDVELCDMLSDFLSGEGFTTGAAHDGNRGLTLALSGHFDALVLDVMMPEPDGLETLKRIRQKSSLPILMLTAKGDDIDRIIGLEIGADDYLPKPFNPKELAARLRAILRRASPKTDADDPSTLKEGSLTIDIGTREARLVDQLLVLTSTEFTLLEILVRHSGRVVSKEMLSEQGLGRPSGPFDRSIDVHISNLRRKLNTPDDDKQTIKTVRGQGYQLIRS